MRLLAFLRKILARALARIKSLNLSRNAKIALLLGVALLFKIASVSSGKAAPKFTTIPISQFLGPMNKRVLETVVVYPEMLQARDKFNNLLRATHQGMPVAALYNELKESGIKFSYAGLSIGQPSLDWAMVATSLISGLLIYYFFIRTKEGKKKPSKPTQKVTFTDIVGLDSAKLALKEVLDYMLNPQKYSSRGARMRRGVLLYGPPGTGKTTLAKACANEANIPFYACNAAQFCEIYVGMGPKKIRDLFAKARQTAPCVIFIDQLDALGSRGSEGGFMFENANSEKNSTINQILSEIDGFDNTDKILVIAATNRLEMVDKSLVRAGRFDVKIHTPLPNTESKVKIFNQYLSRTKHSLSPAFVQRILEESSMGCGADIESLVNEAIHAAIRRNSAVVEQEDLLQVIKLVS